MRGMGLLRMRRLVLANVLCLAVLAGTTAVPASAAHGQDKLLPGEGLVANQWIRSPNSQYMLYMQSDGNAVLYRTADMFVLWATSWTGAPNVAGSRLEMQTDGNLVLYSPTNVALYNTRTWGFSGARLHVQDDGNLVLHNQFYTEALWVYNPDNMMFTSVRPWPCMSVGPNCPTDSTVVTWYASTSVSAQRKSEILYVLEAQYEPTELTITQTTSPIFDAENNGETDIVFYEMNLSDDIRGQTFCEDRDNTFVCDQAYVELNNSPLAPLSTLCHEPGHAIGLQHGEYSDPYIDNLDANLGCMVAPSNTGELRQHNINLINWTY